MNYRMNEMIYTVISWELKFYSSDPSTYPPYGFRLQKSSAHAKSVLDRHRKMHRTLVTFKLNVEP